MCRPYPCNVRSLTGIRRVLICRFAKRLYTFTAAVQWRPSGAAVWTHSPVMAQAAFRQSLMSSPRLRHSCATESSKYVLGEPDKLDLVRYEPIGRLERQLDHGCPRHAFQHLWPRWDVHVVHLLGELPLFVVGAFPYKARPQLRARREERLPLLHEARAPVKQAPLRPVREPRHVDVENLVDQRIDIKVKPKKAKKSATTDKPQLSVDYATMFVERPQTIDDVLPAISAAPPPPNNGGPPGLPPPAGGQQNNKGP